MKNGGIYILLVTMATSPMITYSRSGCEDHVTVTWHYSPPLVAERRDGDPEGLLKVKAEQLINTCVGHDLCYNYVKDTEVDTPPGGVYKVGTPGDEKNKHNTTNRSRVFLI